MTQFGASLRFVELPAVAEFLASVAGTGRLRVSWGEWVGEIVLRRGQIVGASFGDERGLQALQSMAVGFLDGEFTFAHGPVAEDEPPLILASQLAQEYLQRLNAERRAIMEVIDSLSVIPRLVLDACDIDSGDVTIDPAALQIVPMLVSSPRIEDLARRRGLGRTVRDVAALVRAGVVRLDSVSDSPTEEERGSTAPVVPARVHAARRPPQSRAAGTPVRPAHTRPTRLQPRPRPRTDSIEQESPRPMPSPRPTLDNAAIEPPELYAQSALRAAYVRRTLGEADAPRRTPLAGWSEALARILRRPQREHGAAPLFEPRYTYIRTQDPTLPG